MQRRRKAGPRTKAHRALLDAHRHEYDELLLWQGGGCAICGRAPSESRRLDLDHDHKEMVVRGLLCVRCNRALTHHLNAQLLRSMADYLEHPPYAALLAFRENLSQ